MDEDAINKILDSAEQCFERGQYQMALTALNTAIERVRNEGIEISITLDERIDNLGDRISEGPPKPKSKPKFGEEENPFDAPEYRTKVVPEGQQFCLNCKGTGKYLKGREQLITKAICVRCKGKGWQDAADKVRNANYLVRKDREAAKRAAATKYNF